MLPEIKQPINGVLLGRYLPPIYLTRRTSTASLTLLSRRDNHVRLENTAACENFNFEFFM